MKIRPRFWNRLSEEERQAILSRSETDISAVSGTISLILAEVKQHGDSAIIAYTREFDGVDLSNLPFAVTADEFTAAGLSLAPDVKNAIEYAIENVRRFHLPQKPESFSLNEIRPGVYAGERATPIGSAGLYVPRGRGSFPSMLYMLAVPAQVAGVERVCVVTPPGPGGEVDAACLYAASLCGVEKVYRIGGSQSIAALAYGTETIAAVDKIVGPGSMYVSAAKRILYGTVDVGLPAGPSESVVIADESADPWKVTLDLMIEAEHGSDSSAILVTPSIELAEACAALLENEIETLEEPRKTFVRDVFSNYGAILVTEKMSDAIDFVNDFAPEHLQIQTRDPFTELSGIKNAGEILLGDKVPFSLANYAVGANAVLPTGGKAKTYSAVSVRDFMKFSSIVYLTEEGYADVSEKARVLADYEGFQTHANAVVKRSL